MDGRRAGAHDGSEPGFSFASVAGHSLPQCSPGLGLARMLGAGVARLGRGAGLLGHKLRVRGFCDHTTKA